MKTSTILSLVAGLTATMTGLSHAQTFNNLYGTAGGESANGIVSTRDGGYATAGSIMNAGSDNRDILVVKYAADGKLDWSIRFGGNGQDIGYSIEQTSDGGFIIGAETTSMGTTQNLALLRLDAAGNYRWSRVYEGDTSSEDMVNGQYAGVGVAIAPESPNIQPGFALVARKRVSNTNQRGVVIRTDALGAPIFNQGIDDSRYGVRTKLSFTDVVFDSDGTMVLTGTGVDTTAAGAGRLDPLVMRLNNVGNPIFAISYPSSLPAGGAACKGTANGLTLMPNRDIVFNGHNDLAGGTQNAMTVRLDPAGGINWTSVVGRSGVGFRSIELDPRGDLSQSGWVGVFPASKGLLSVLSPLGSVNFHHVYEHLLRAEGHRPCPMTYGYALAGTVTLPTGYGSSDIEMIHTDDLGWVGCLESEIDLPRPQVSVLPRPTQLTRFPQASQIWQAAFQRVVLQEQELCVETVCPPCAADYNQDGGADGDDVRAFFDDWQDGQSCADVNQDGGIDFDDAEHFHRLWAAGGC
ncbi:MAG: hypothetical protein RL689_1125 [Planctomycetota bacterium]|jgi:hypothetical protein